MVFELKHEESESALKLNFLTWSIHNIREIQRSFPETSQIGWIFNVWDSLDMVLLPEVGGMDFTASGPFLNYKSRAVTGISDFEH